MARLRGLRGSKSRSKMLFRPSCERLEARAMLVGDLNVFLNGLFPSNFPPNSPVEDGWDEGEDLVISLVQVFEEVPGEEGDISQIRSGAISNVKWRYTFTDENSLASFTYDVPLNTDPNVTVPWSAFATGGINDGLGFVSVKLQALDELGNPYLNSNNTVATTDDTPIFDTTSILLENEVPTITNIEHTTAGGSGCEGGPTSVTLTATLGDSSPSDIVTATVNWGDGSIDLLDLDNEFSFDGSESHVYITSGTYTVTITAMDDDGDMTVTEHEVEVTVGGGGGGPSVCFDDGEVIVTGSSVDDNVFVTLEGGLIRISADFLTNVDQFVEFPTANVQQIHAVLGDGNDVFAIIGGINVPVVVSGGAGNDILTGGPGRSILIGGTGSDALAGGGGEDILIGGTTAFDDDATALLLLLAEWNSANSLEQRIRNLVNGSGTVGGGANGTTYLTDGVGGTIQNDNQVDLLLGGSGTDWLFLNGLLERFLALGSSEDLRGDDLDFLFN